MIPSSESRIMDNRKRIKEGVRDGIPIMAGYFAVSFAIGIQSARIGMTSLEAGLFSLLNLTSAGEMAGLSVIAAQGSYMEMALVQSVINLRYLLMSAALSQKAEPSLPTRHRLLIAYGVTDEIFGVSVLKEGALHPFYSYGLIGISALGWVAGTVTGAKAGSILPPLIISALGLALYGMFIAIVVPAARSERKLFYAVLAAAAISTLLTYLPLTRLLSEGVRIVLVTVFVSFVCAALWPQEGNGNDA